MKENIIEKALPKNENANIIKEMLRLLKDKRIDLNEYLQRCAYWGMKTLDDIYFRSMPTKPLIVFEYEQLSYYEKNKLPQSYFVNHPGITRYYEERDLIIRENSNNLWKMSEYKKYIPESDKLSYSKLDKGIKDFKLKIGGYNE